MMGKTDSLFDIVILLYKWRKQLIIATLVAAIITAGISLLLPNYYAASTQFYAASPDLAKPSPIGVAENNIDFYGNDQDIDRLLAISKSNEVSDHLINEFDLYTHYQIKPDSKHAKHKLLLKLNKLFEATKTKYDGINLRVEDKDISKVADMANSARNKIEEVAQRLIKESQKNLINGHKSNIDIKQGQLDALTDSLYVIRSKYKIFNTASQGEAFGSSMVTVEGKYQRAVAEVSALKESGAPRDTIIIMEAKLKGYQNQLSALQDDIKKYNDGYPTIVSLERDIKDYGEQLAIDKERLKQLEAVYNSDFNTIHIIEEAVTPVYKSRPKRSIYVIGVAMMTFILACLWVLLMDQFKKNSWGEQLKNA